MSRAMVHRHFVIAVYVSFDAIPIYISNTSYADAGQVIGAQFPASAASES